MRHPICRHPLPCRQHHPRARATLALLATGTLGLLTRYVAAP